MLFSESYFQIKGATQANLRERGSKFLAFAFPVFSEEEVKKNLKDIKGKYPDATHHCYAYILNPDKAIQKASDDGEPSNSAGKPILRAMLSKDLTNVLVIVVRYFGGTMLGIPGLIQAYGQAAKLALDEAEIEEVPFEVELQISGAFDLENQIYQLINKYGCRIIEKKYDDRLVIKLALKRNMEPAFVEAAGKNYLLEIKSI